MPSNLCWQKWHQWLLGDSVGRAGLKKGLTNEQEETCRSDGYSHYLDWVMVLHVDICQNWSNSHFNICTGYCLSVIHQLSADKNTKNSILYISESTNFEVQKYGVSFGRSWKSLLVLGYPCLNIVDKNPAGSGTHRLFCFLFWWLK